MSVSLMAGDFSFQSFSFILHCAKINEWIKNNFLKDIYSEVGRSAERWAIYRTCFLLSTPTLWNNCTDTDSHCTPCSGYTSCIQVASQKRWWLRAEAVVAAVASSCMFQAETSAKKKKVLVSSSSVWLLTSQGSFLFKPAFYSPPNSADSRCFRQFIRFHVAPSGATEGAYFLHTQQYFTKTISYALNVC